MSYSPKSENETQYIKSRRGTQGGKLKKFRQPFRRHDPPLQKHKTEAPTEAPRATPRPRATTTPSDVPASWRPGVPASCTTARQGHWPRTTVGTALRQEGEALRPMQSHRKAVVQDAGTPGHRDAAEGHPVSRITKSEGPRICIQGPGGKIKKAVSPERAARVAKRRPSGGAA